MGKKASPSDLALGEFKMETQQTKVEWSRRIARSFVLLVGIGLIFSMLYYVLVLLGAPQNPRMHSWTLNIQFVFSGAERGVYPNGMTFAATDLLAAPVLEKALRLAEDVPETLDAAALDGKLSVAGHYPDARRLERDYVARMTDDMSLAEVQELERSFLSAFERGARGQARLILTSHDPDLPGGAILEAIPHAWAQYMREKYGVFESDRDLFSPDALAVDVFEEVDFLMTYAVLREQFRLLEHNLGVLQQEPNSGRLRDDETGLRLSDVEARVRQMQELFLDSLLSQVMSLGMVTEPELTLRFFRLRLDELERQSSVLETKSEIYRQTLARFADNGRLDNASGDNLAQRIVGLGAQRGEREFRQELTREKLDVDLQAAALRSEIQMMEGLMTLAGSDMVGAATLEQPMDNRTVTETEQAFEQVVSDLRLLFAVTERIASQLDGLFFGDSQVMFNMGSVPREPGSGSVSHGAGALRWYWLTLAAVLIASLIAVLVWQVAGRFRVVK